LFRHVPLRAAAAARGAIDALLAKLPKGTQVGLVVAEEGAEARFDAAGRQVNGQFGQFTAARNARIIQFALKFNF
jgi:hypothetical protein